MYAVKKGIKPGIYTTWNDAKLQVNGFKGAEYKKFNTKLEAENYIAGIKPGIPPGVVYTDGSCKDNQGGYSFVSATMEQYGPIPNTTNQYAELYAVYQALLHHDDIVIRTDSQYTINCLTTWLPIWKKNGFVTSDGQPVKHQELILKIDHLNKNVKYEHVYSHNNDEWNEYADRLANLGRINDSVVNLIYKASQI